MREIGEREFRTLTKSRTIPISTRNLLANIGSNLKNLIEDETQMRVDLKAERVRNQERTYSNARIALGGSVLGIHSADLDKGPEGGGSGCTVTLSLPKINVFDTAFCR